LPFTVTGTIADMHVRKGTDADLLEISRIQHSAPEAAQWDPSGYEFMVVECEGSIAGFLAWRTIARGEIEILNLAVSPKHRRGGAALMLIQALPVADCFLEVRESNQAARSLYRKAGFTEQGIRYGYYSDPAEPGIVMRLQS